MSTVVRKEFYSDCCWTAPAGVSSVVVYPILYNGDIVSSGYLSSFVISTNCTVYAWGNNEEGYLGDGTVTPRCCPVPVCGGIKFIHLAGTKGLDFDGRAYAWGANGNGYLGDGTTTSRCCPVPVCGGLRFKQISYTNAHTVAITPEGYAYAWGDNSYGSLGDGTTTSRCCPVPVCGGLRFKQVIASDGYSLGLTPEGCAYAWGYNFYGYLGDGTITPRCCPVPVCGGLRFRSLGSPTHGVTCDGVGYSWGYNNFGALGDGTNTHRCCPVRICGCISWKCITASMGIACDGAAYVWGIDNNGRLGNNTTSGVKCCPVAVCGGLKFSELRCVGSYGVVGVDINGNIYNWGEGACGSLGNALTSDRCCPVPVCGGLKARFNINSKPRYFSVVPNETYEIKIFAFHQTFNNEPVSSLESGLILEYQL